MTLSSLEVSGIAAHIGYGNPQAALWFVGSEEGLGGKMNPEERAANLRARAKWQPVMDLGEAHATLREQGGYITDLINRPGSTQVWRYMARIARAYEGSPQPLDSLLAAKYVRHSLGRADGKTFLTEVDPFPARRQRQPTDLSDFADRDLLEGLRAERKAQQLELLKSAKPRAVICYGTSMAQIFQQHFALQWRLLGSFSWRSVKSGAAREKAIYYAELRLDQSRKTSAFLLPFFGQGQLSPEVLRAFLETSEFQSCRAQLQA